MTYSIEIKGKRGWIQAGAWDEIDDAIACARTIAEDLDKTCRVVSYKPEYLLFDIFFSENS
jgi:hypothetical protein